MHTYVDEREFQTPEILQWQETLLQASEIMSCLLCSLVYLLII